MSYIRFVASVDKKHHGQLDEIILDLERLGLSVEKVRRLTGTISGSADSITSVLSVNIPGLTIELEREYYTQVA